MSGNRRINPGQSKTARSLLKCNIQDVEKMSKQLDVHRIREFEEGKEPLIQADMNDLIHTYEKQGITFMDDGRVTYTEPKEEKKEGSKAHDLPINAAPTHLQTVVNPAPFPQPKPSAPATTKVIGGVMLPSSAMKSAKPIVPQGNKPKKPF